jgi:phage terminase large subunit-like protein
LSGRGWGKTRTGAEWIVYQALSQPKTRWAVVARTSADIRDTVFEGESGLISVIKRYGLYNKDHHNISSHRYVFPNGSIIKGYSAEQPDALRGPQHHGAWCDELAAWEYPETYDQLAFGLRLGSDPKTVITTTPKPTKIIKDLMSRETTYVTRGNTFENAANLAPTALAELQHRYAGTRLGRQELFGEVLDDNPGALWNRTLIEENRIKREDLPPLMRVVVGIDPAVTSGEDSDFTGIVTAGVTADGHYYIIADNTMKASPQEWATKAIEAYKEHKADRIIAEVNNGGDLVIHLLQQVDANVSTKKVTATRGKRVRAEPIAALMEQSRCHMVGYFGDLENEMCEWTPDSPDSPDRLDAMVWALTELSESSGTMTALGQMAKFCPICRMPNNKSATHCFKCGTKLKENSWPAPTTALLTKEQTGFSM